ncbi:MAG: Ig-like domain-containing protein [Burkholderiaceae bacterium]|nr:Ig-like domain-containing protein [Burkholderiaceae bacterium]
MTKISTVSRGWPWLVAIGLSGALSACGGGGQTPILGGGDLALEPPLIPVAPSLSPLSVTGVTPAPHAAGLAVNTRFITAAFNKPMDVATLNAQTFTLACPSAVAVGGGVVTYVAASQTAVLTLPVGTLLPANSVCSATIHAAATDRTGMALASNHAWQFGTGASSDTTAPTVTHTGQANGASGVALNTKVEATFSEAMNPLTINNRSFTLQGGGVVVPGTTGYSGVSMVFVPTRELAPGTTYTATIGTGAVDLAGNALAAEHRWSWTTAAAADTTAPLVTTVAPADLASNVHVASTIKATFSEAMDPLSISSASFRVAGVPGAVSFHVPSRVATFTPHSALSAGTAYTATVTRGAVDLAGNALATDKTWTFTTAAVPLVPLAFALKSAAPYGSFGGSAGMTNMGTLTRVNGDIGTTGTTTSTVTGFHDSMGDIYTETPTNAGVVSGKIYSCTNSTTGPTSAGVNAPACAVATLARLEAQATYLALVARPVGGASPAPGANLAGVTLQPGTYVAPGGAFLIQGGDLTLDAQGDANAIWVFQMASTLTVGGPGAAFPQSIILAGGAQAKNVFWQVGSFATINAAGGGTMVGTLISQEGMAFSTAGNSTVTTLNGRALSLGASVTLVNTVINVPQ